jgi:predicted transcriptional regulator
MPDADHPDSRPPAELNYPETLRITVASGEAAFDEALGAAGAAEGGEQPPAVVSFETAAGVRRLLTDRRLELVRSLVDEPASSIAALARRIDRSYSVVHDDLDVLAEYRIVEFRHDGRTKRPFVPYERIHLDVEIVGDTDAPESTPA